ncbi:MAG: hypothetical protein JNK05_40455 [Myxococcales bacterium]|nr:hypothetical protein [Myxococcales bacterium]
MTNDEATVPADVFEADRPLPWIAATSLSPERDAIAVAELAVARAESNDDREAQAEASMQLSDAWLAVGALAPALAAAQRALAALASFGPALDRAASLLSRAGAHADAAELYARRAELGHSAALRAAAESFVRAGQFAKGLEYAVRYRDESRGADASAFAVEVARAVGDPAAIVAQLEAHLARAETAEDRQATYVDLWVETRGARYGAAVAAPLLETSPDLARSILRESLARAVQASQWESAIEAASALAPRCEDGDERAAVALVLALVERSAAARERARDALAEHGDSAWLLADLWADAEVEPDEDLAAASWKGIAAMLASADPERAIEAWGRALERVPDDEDALAALGEVEASREKEDPLRVAALDALAAACVARDDRPKARARLALAWAEREAARGDLCARERAKERAAALGVTVASDDAARNSAASARRQIEEVLDGYERSHGDPRLIEPLVRAIDATPGAIDAPELVARTSRTLAMLAPSNEPAARAWIRLLSRGDDREALELALRRVATRGATSALRVRAATRLAGLAAGGRSDASATIDLLELVLDETRDTDPRDGETPPISASIAAAIGSIAARCEDHRLVRNGLVSARTAWTSGALSTGSRLLGRVLGQERGEDPVAELFDEQSRLRARVGAWSALAESGAGFAESRSSLARWTRTLLASASDPAVTLEVSTRFAKRAPLSAEAAFARFGAASMGTSLEVVAESTAGVLRALSAAKDAAGLARSSITKLSAALGERAVLPVALEAAWRVGLSDKSLRATLVALADRSAVDSSTAKMLLEAALLANAVEEQIDGAIDEQAATLLRKLLERAKADGAAREEARVLRRLSAVVQADRSVLVPWVRALSDSRDAPGLLFALPALLALELEDNERRDALWLLAGAQRALSKTDDTIQTLERIGSELTSIEDRALVVRALEELGASRRAYELLSQWGSTTDDTEAAAALLCRAAIAARAHRAPALEVFALAREALVREPETPEALVLAEEVAQESQLVPEMLALYQTLDELAAGAHGRAALTYRRALFLEHAGHADPALEAYFTAFDARPARGAVASAIARLAVGRRPDMLVALHRRLADGAATGNAKVEHLLDAARAAKLEAHDKRGALRLLLEAQDVLRDANTTALVLDLARELRAEDPEAHRTAAEAIAERGLAVAEEVWDDDARRAHALRAFECAVADLDDPDRARRAAEAYLRESDNEEQHVGALRSVLRSAKASTKIRAALKEIPSIARRSSSATQAAVHPGAQALETTRSLAAQGDVPAALTTARAALSRGDDAELRSYAESLARSVGDAQTELELIDGRRPAQFDPARDEADLLRTVELMRGPLAKLDEAWRRLSHGLTHGLRSDASLRIAHELAEQRQDWSAVSSVLELRIARAEDRAESRALRLRRAAVLEQRLDNPAAARVELEAVIEDEPSHRPALRYLADLHLRAERFSDAGECYARAAAATHGKAEAAELLSAAGESFEAGRDDAAAQAQYRRALELDPASARALAGLDRVLRARGDLDALERSLVALANTAAHEADRAQLRLAAARAALDAGAIFRAKTHVDNARSHASPAEIAALDAQLERAREDDRPISRSRMASVVVSEPPRSLAPSTAQPEVERRAVAVEPVVQSELLEEPLLIEPLPPGSRASSTKDTTVIEALMGEPSSTRDLSGVEENVLRAWYAEGDDEAGQELVNRLVRSESGREEALRIERDRFAKQPTRLDRLQSIEGLLSMLDRPEHALAVRSVRETLSGIEPQGVAPPLNRTPEPPPDAVARWLLPVDGAEYAEIGALMWDSLGTLFRREITGYGVTGVDRVMSAAPTEIARMYTAIARLLQMPRTAVFVRAQVPGGIQVARTQPPSVILASALSHDAPVSRYLLGNAMEGTRPSWVLTALDATDRAVLVRALLATFGPKGKLQGEPPEVTRRARDLVGTIPPRAQKKIEELLAAMDAQGEPFTENAWVEFADRARARAGLFASGDFAVASQMVVVRHKGGGEADVPGSIGRLGALDDLACFAISDPFLRLRWETIGNRRR